jgi:Holliday junction DNA helicase RuvA
MYESVRGRVVSKEPSRCVVEAGDGVAYSVSVPLSTFERLPAVGEQASLRLHLSVREDDWRLFGFLTEEERALFRSCLKVSGVGPVTALALLSGLSPRDLRAAVTGGDVKALAAVKGIGKKTAERLVVELRDALGGVDDAAAGPATPIGPLADATSALVALGLDRDEAL